MIEGTPPRVVFDCMVFLQATARPEGPAARLFVEFVEGGRLALYVSDTIMDEVRDVLGRSRIRSKNPTITDATVEAFCTRVLQSAHCLEVVPTSMTLPRDPNDEPYLNLAIASAADYLATRDNDMLDLMKDAEFRSRYPRLTILDPVALIRTLEQPGQS
ncbi:putative toxin-antitoxin system toxin component, PIN family [Tundrisphaera lichenicola]|uniref:putative toxin-antitoxin system toxin component, PIN family n=1 Tax=Tundrisphaera lichenicola TaxID=2029860 RepID=UPI003EBB600B